MAVGADGRRRGRTHPRARLGFDSEAGGVPSRGGCAQDPRVLPVERGGGGSAHPGGTQPGSGRRVSYGAKKCVEWGMGRACTGRPRSGANEAGGEERGSTQSGGTTPVSPGRWLHGPPRNAWNGGGRAPRGAPALPMGRSSTQRRGGTPPGAIRVGKSSRQSRSWSLTQCESRLCRDARGGETRTGKEASSSLICTRALLGAPSRVATALCSLVVILSFFAVRIHI